MRIIGGKFKGKKIFIPSSKNTRPLKDLVKESIFNLLMHSNKISCSLHNSKILDLFSGIGSFGLECISRYSSKVIFFENYLETLKILRQNLNLIGDSNAVYQVIEEDCFKFFEKNKKYFLNEEFDIIFIDPPFKEKRTNYLINSILEKKLLKKSGVIILHKHKKDNTTLNSNLKIVEERNYGISKIILGN